MATKTLELRFQNSESRLVTIRIPSPKEDLTSSEISDVMDTIIATPIFVGNAHELVHKVNARVVSRAVEEIEVE